MATIVESLSRYASGLRYEHLPPAVATRAKVCVLDLLGGALGGSERENARIARRTANAIGAAGTATVWVTGEKLRASDAVLANSVAAHCYLQDDWLPRSHSHPGAVVVPAALAVAEETQASGRQVIVSIVAAYDIEDRIGTLSVPSFGRGFRVSSVYGYFGAAATAASLLNLNAAQYAHALACAASMCGGILQPWTDGSMEWSFQEAFAGRSGILAAMLAREGLIGSANVVEGPNGVNHCFSGTNEGSGEALDRLGTHYRITETCYKRFPTGGANQGSATLAHALRSRHAFRSRDIEQVIVEVPKNGTHERMNYAGIPYAGPFSTIDQCLISKPFAIGMILHTGDMALGGLEAARTDPKVLALAGKIELREVDGRAGWDLRMEIALADGTRITGDSTDMDTAQVTLDLDSAVAKFLKNAIPVLAAPAAETLAQRIVQLDQQTDIGEITALMRRA